MNRTPSSHPSPPVGEKVPEGRMRGISNGSWHRFASNPWRFSQPMNRSTTMQTFVAYATKVCTRPSEGSRAQGAISPKTEVRKTCLSRRIAGARRSRRFTVGMVWCVFESLARWTLKRPEGRAPCTWRDLTSVFGIRDWGGLSWHRDGARTRSRDGRDTGARQRHRRTQPSPQ
jgi:hypothetical protein